MDCICAVFPTRPGITCLQHRHHAGSGNISPESIDVVLNVNYSDAGSYVNSEFISAHTAARTINFTDIEITSSRESLQNNKESILITINASKNALSGDYKVLLGIGNDEITVSKFINVKIES